MRCHKAKSGSLGLLVTLLSFLLVCPAAQALTLQPVATEAVGVANALVLAPASAMPPTVHLTFALQSAALSNVDDYAASLTDRASPNYHRWLTPQEFGAMFGAKPSDIGAVTQYLSQNGFTNIKAWNNRLFVSADTSSANAQQLFMTKILSYQRSRADVAQGLSPTYYAPSSEPLIPALIASKLSGVFGLSNIGEHKSAVVRPLSQPGSSNSPLNPSDLGQIYNGSALRTAGYTGTGVTVGIFSPTTYNPNDINSFLNANSISGTKISTVNVNGGARNNQNALEACLDIETVVGQAPGATIKVYEGPNDGSLDIFNKMADDDPAIVTESYSSDENSVTSAFAASYETLRRQMAIEGISIVVASGDNGAFDSNNQSTVTTSVDATSNYVISVGGTELLPFSNNIAHGEVAWTYNDGTLGVNGGSGGGLSIYYPEPSWQTGPGVSNVNSNGMRQIPDVALLASTPFYNIFAQGSFGGLGGTSAACQLFGGTLALLDQEQGARLGNIDPILYSYGATNSAVYHDITSGANGVFSCTPGWDFVTGWGTVNFAKLALAFQGTSSATSPVYTFPAGLQMFSLPYTFPKNDAGGELLNGLIAPNGFPAYVIASWLPATANYVVSPNVAAASPTPGLGYWARFGPTGSGSLTAIGSPIGAPTFSITLSTGWNMIGDPYTSSVPIGSLTIQSSTGTTSFNAAAAAGTIQPNIYDYNGAVYVPHNSSANINPYDAYWIYSTVTCGLTFSSP